MFRILLLQITCATLLADSVSAQSTPEQKFFEWTSLQFPATEYAERRTNLLRELKSVDGVYLTSSRDGFSYGETFRQLNDFLYLTGLELPNTILVIDSRLEQTVLFVPVRDLRFESASRKNDFPGRALLEDNELQTKSGINDIRPISQLDNYLAEVSEEGQPLFINTGRQTAASLETSYIYSWNPDLQLAHHLQKSLDSVQIENAYGIMGKMRMIHSRNEIEVLKKAAQITQRGIRHAASFIQPGVDERTLEGEMEAEFKREGSQRLAFSSIIKSGPNSLWPWRILAAHYDRRNREMQSGDLVIFDVGCEYNYYSSDVGRTFPVSGKFTPEQKAILTMEVAVADAIIAAIKPGVTFADLKKVAFDDIPDDQEEFMQVGLFHGHHIGLSVSDPYLPDVPLKPGMIFTVEPWYYNHQTGISVFTEDEVLVTENGVEVLTKDLPRSPEELEQMVGGQ